MSYTSCVSAPGKTRRQRVCTASTGLLLLLSLLLCSGPAVAELLYITEANNLRRLDITSVAAGRPRSEIFIQHAARNNEERSKRSVHADARRRDINGMTCRLPGGGFVAGEDTGQPSPPPGWGIFDDTGAQIGKLTTTYLVDQGEPYGCGVDAQGRLFTSALGNVGFGSPRGQLILWWPPFDHFPGSPGEFPSTDATSTNFCKLAVDIGNALGVAIDAEGRVYVASSGRGAIYRFSPPFPTSPDAEGGCGRKDSSGAPLADAVQREIFFDGLYTFSGLAFAANGNLYAASVFTGEILEIDPAGGLVRKLLDPDGMLPPFETGSPMGLAVDSQGRLYYADIDLAWDFPSIGPGGNGKVRRIAFDSRGHPQPPEILIEGLGFPDGLGIMPGALPEPGR